MKRKNRIILLVFFCLLVVAQGQAQLLGTLFGNGEEFLSNEVIEVEWTMSGVVQADLNEGINLFDEGDFGAAIGNLTTAIELDSNKLWAGYYYRGLCHKMLREWSSAEADLNKALQIKGQNPSILLELGKINALQKIEDKAERYFKEYTALFPNDARGPYLTACLKIKAGDFQGAKRHLKKSIDTNEKFPEAYAKLAVVEMWLKQNPKAGMKYLDQSLAIDSMNQQALLIRSILSAERNPQKSIADLSKLIRVSPGNLEFRSMRGFLLTDQGDYEKAFSDLHHVIQEIQRNPNEFKGKQTSLDRMIDVQYAGYYAIIHIYGMPDELATAVKRGFCQLVTGRYDEAIKSFETVVQRDTTAVSAFMSAVAHEHSGSHVKALKYYGVALDRDNEIFDAHKKRGVYRTELKQWDEAIRDFNEMLRIDKTSLVAYKFRGISFYHKGDFELAKNDFSRYLTKDSTDKEVFGFRGMCHRNLGNELLACYDLLAAGREDGIGYPLLKKTIFNLLKSRDTTRAEKEINRIIKKFPRYASAYAVRIGLHERWGDWKSIKDEIDNAIDEMKRGYFDFQGSAYLLVVKSKILSREEKQDEALKHLDEAIRIYPNYGDAYFERGKIHLTKKNLKIARQDLIQAKNLGIKDAEILLAENKLDK